VFSTKASGCCFVLPAWFVNTITVPFFPRHSCGLLPRKEILNVRDALRFSHLTLVWTVVFLLGRFSSSYGSLLFLSSFEAEVFPDLAPLFPLSFSWHCLPFTKEIAHSLS
jgi:hypothetical protein